MKISLTIDNGPNAAVTPYVLDVLAHEQVPATFFVLGSEAEKRGSAAIMERAVREGHAIGNHTFSHQPLDECDPAKALDEIIRTQRAIAPYARHRLFRPPAGGQLRPGIIPPAAYDHLCREGYTIALWTSVPGDWLDPDGWPDVALDHARARDWTVTVVHDIETGAMRHLARFIDMVRRDGGEFVHDLPAAVTPVVNGRELWSLAGLEVGDGNHA